MTSNRHPLREGGTIGPIKMGDAFITLNIVFLVAGSLLAIFAAIHLVMLLVDGYSAERLGDFLVNGILGVLYLACRQLLLFRRRGVAVLFLVALSLSLGYSLFMGRGLNLVTVAFGILVGVLLYQLQTSHR